MPMIIQTLGLPFLTCVLMSSLLGYLGTHILKREVIFIDIALAQIAAIGAIVAHLIFEAHSDSVTAYLCSFGFVVLISGFYALVRSRITQISLEAVIGISYAIGAAGALFLVGIAPGSHMHMQSILSGNLLWVNVRQVLTILAVFIVTGFIFYLIRKPVGKISNDYKNCQHKGVKIIFWDFVFYVFLGIIITISVETGGIVVVFAFLIIPGTISSMISLRFSLQLATIWVSAIIASLSGLLFAYYLDFSIGPSIALFLGGELIICASIKYTLTAHKKP